MAEAYCVKCKAKREMTDAKEETMKNGRPILKGKCPECGTTICKILPSKKQLLITLNYVTRLSFLKRKAGFFMSLPDCYEPAWF